MHFKWTFYRACWFCVLQALLACALAFQSAHGAPSFVQALSEFNSGHYSKALTVFQQYSLSHPSDIVSHYYTGMCYQYLNQVALASREYQWVARYSHDPKLKSQAQNGVAQLSRYQANRGYDGYSAPASATPVQVATATQTGDTSKLAKGGRLKVMEFYTQWCGVCKRYAPVFDQVQGAFGRECDFQTLDAEDPANQKLVQRYMVGAYPTTVIADSAGNPIDRFAGMVDVGSLQNAIDNSLKKIK